MTRYYNYRNILWCGIFENLIQITTNIINFHRSLIKICHVSLELTHLTRYDICLINTISIGNIDAGFLDIFTHLDIQIKITFPLQLPAAQRSPIHADLGTNLSESPKIS
ncbi:hypothetical protein AAHE18_04G169200 [Arachis hypogaea]